MASCYTSTGAQASSGAWTVDAAVLSNGYFKLSYFSGSTGEAIVKTSGGYGSIVYLTAP
jgi:hypothetical protein